MDKHTLRTLRQDAGLSVDRAAAFLGINPRTLRRWEAGDSRIPPAALVALSVAAGHLDPYGAPFAGWTARNGELATPEGEQFHIGTVRAAPFLRQTVRALIDELQRTRAELAKARADLELARALVRSTAEKKPGQVPPSGSVRRRRR